MTILANAGSIFAFAASEDEYAHRNRYVRKIAANKFEAWIGRDLRKYLPGIYWLAALSQKYLDIIPRVTSPLEATATQIGAEHWLIRAFEHPQEWQQHAARLDEWCVEQPDVFSKQRAQRQLDEAPDLGKLMELAGEWR